MMYMEPRSTGPHELHMSYGEGTEGTVSRILMIIGLAAVVAIAITAMVSKVPSPVQVN